MATDQKLTAAWWEQLKDVQRLSGDEIVLHGDEETVQEYSAPVVLARVRQPGLEGFMRREMRRLNANARN